MKNFIQSGHRVAFTAAAARVSGEIIVIGDYVGVNSYDVAIGEEGELALTGVYKLPKAAGVALAIGDTAHLTAGEIDDTGANPLVGTVHKAAAGGDSEVEVLLKQGPAAGLH